MTEFSAADLAACAEREVKFRRRVYLRRAPNGVLPPAAQREIALMEQIAREYRRKADDEAAKADLFGGM